jgi:hypothetical protein
MLKLAIIRSRLWISRVRRLPLSVGVVQFVALLVLTTETVRSAMHVSGAHGEGSLADVLLLAVSVSAIALALNDAATRFREFRARPVLSAAAPFILLVSGLSFYAGLVYLLFWGPSWWWFSGYFLAGVVILGGGAGAFERLTPDQDDLFEWAFRQEFAWSRVTNGDYHPITKGVRWWINPHAEADFPEDIVLPPRDDEVRFGDPPPRFSPNRIRAARPAGAAS